jgi:uncharacterized lipoprotein YbaY
MDVEPLVSGEIVFGTGEEAFSEATATVRLEDTSRADAPSRLVAGQVIRHVAYRPGQEVRLPFALYGPAPDERVRYTVSAHLDVAGNGRLSRGDYINVQSYPVLTFGHPREVTVHLRKI